MLFEVARKQVSKYRILVVNQAQSIVNSIFEKDYLAASVASASLLANGIEVYCGVKGSPRAPLLFGAQIGFSPGFKPDDYTAPCVQGTDPGSCPSAVERRPGGIFGGAFIGTYVPFFDFR